MPRVRSLTYPEVNGHRDRIKGWLDAGVTVSTIHQRLRDDHGLAAGLTSVRRYVWLEFPDRDVNPDRVTVLRPEVEPGSEAQIDYGYLGQWRDPIEDRLRKVWAFVMVLACSRHMFVRPVLRMDQTAWVAAHVAAFEFFGGVPARLVPDNLATGVTKPDLYDPKVNRACRDVGGVAAGELRAGRVVVPEGGHRLPRQGRGRALLGAVAAHGPTRRCPHERPDRGDLRRPHPGQDPPSRREGTSDGLG